MKKFNFTNIVLPFLPLLLIGCMPDSLTKFDKEAPKKAAAATATPVPPIVDDSGNTVDPVSIVYPTKFFYYTESPTISDKAVVVGDAVSLKPTIDGDLSNPTMAASLVLDCSLDQTGTVRTRTLPPGLALNKKTCEISGTPTAVHTDVSPNVGNLIPYNVIIKYKGASYNGSDASASTMSAPINIGVYQAPTAFSLTQNDKLVLEVSQYAGNTLSAIKTNTNPATAYDRHGVITSIGGVSAIVKYVNASASTIGVFRVTPLVVASVSPFSTSGPTSFISTASNTKTGKILSINTSTKTLYVETLTPTTNFAAGDSIDNAISFSSAETSITSVNSNYILSNATSSEIDNDSQFFSRKFSMNNIIQVYEVGVTIPDIKPIETPVIAAANGIKYTISPALPDGLSFNADTGVISGAFTDTMDTAAFTVTARNPIGTASKTINIVAIRVPKDLSYTQRQLISVFSNSVFENNETLFQPITPPLVTSIKGRVLRKISTDKMSILTSNGAFLENAVLDSGNAFYSEKSYIPASSLPNYYNIALNVNTTASFTEGGYVSSSSGALGRVIYKAGTVLYIQFLTPDPTSVVTFTDSDNLDNAETFSSTKATVSAIDAENLVVSLNASLSAVSGDDFTSDNNISGYIYKSVDAFPDVRIFASDINSDGTNYLQTGALISLGEIATGVQESITSVTHDNFIILEKGQPVTIMANMSQGSSVIYNISPALPAGLTLDPATGVISGTPTLRLMTKSYVITATNLLGSSSYAFTMEVRDYFTFAETSGAKSFLTHKVGSKHTQRACKINATDILNPPSSTIDTALDIGCYVEAEEMELYYTKLKMEASVGGGVCDYVSFTPYAFWQYNPAPSSKTVDFAADGCTGIGGAYTEQPTTENACDSNYTNSGGPNCDTGTVTVKSWTDTDSNASCDAFTSRTFNCGGKATRCLAGAVTSVIRTEASREAGVRGIAVNASSGLKQTWTIDSPADFLDITNLRNTNDFARNSCDQSRAAASTLSDAAYATSGTASPFGRNSVFYEFKCLDAAQDVKARIRVVVRDWDRTFKITSGVESKVPASGFMNSTGTDSLFGSYYNTRLDWDNDYTDSDLDSNYIENGVAPACGTITTYPYPGSNI